MAVLTEGPHPGSFLIWEVLRDYTRETVTLASGAGKLAPGTVLGRITTGGKYTVLTPGASNGSQNAAGILWGPADASDADAPGVVLVRGPALVNRHEIAWPDAATEGQIATATTALAALGILLR
ncbi:head decoration protein [Rhodobaculum claviforme]|uniref:Head decoration protein n=1 Tax=Rhodobaculum claviforme TaxID=1549854 RepID=A0A934TLK0_9RHOB|nr:head decoration protein [Rhodobaculum claviforme]MBK5927372.1 head decoration protein [Rhodobaculum claviforme]